MGKARREEKLRKREQGEVRKVASEPQAFSWKRYFQLLGRTLPRMLLLFAATMLVNYALIALKVTFFASGLGQLLLFIPMYVMVFIWTQQVAREMRSPPSVTSSRAPSSKSDVKPR